MFGTSLLDVLTSTPDALDEFKLKPNRADYRRAKIRRAKAPTHPYRPRKSPRPAQDDVHWLSILDTRTADERADDQRLQGKLDAAFNRQLAIDEDDRPQWVTPQMEQEQRDRRAGRRRGRAARRTARS